MKTIYFLWYQLNWLELVTYILIPTAMVLVILTYILFNVRALKLSFDVDINLIKLLEKSNNMKFDTILKKIDELNDDNSKIIKKIEKVESDLEKDAKKGWYSLQK